jgi:glycine C-acetyltransferase
MDSDKYSLADFIEFNDEDIFAKTRKFAEYSTDYIDKGYYTYFRQNTGDCGARVKVIDHYSNETREMIMMASNNYLSLAQRPEVIEAGTAALKKYGAGSNGSPLLCGHTDIHRELELKLAKMKGCEDAMIFSSGFTTNIGAITALVRKDDFIVADRLDHASILDGCLATGAKFRTFRHNDADSLRQILSHYSPKVNGKLVIIEGVYSMDGDVADLPNILAACKDHGARLMIDEAHATGVLGKTGKGTLEHYGLDGQVDIVMGTFSKAIGVNGGFICSSKEVVDYLRFYSRSYFFSTALTPVNVACALKALELIEKGDDLRAALWDNIHYMTSNLKRLGFQVVEGQSAIIPIMIGDDVILRKMSAEIHKQGIFLNSVFYPAVPKNSSRIRMSLMASHSRTDLNKTLEVLETVGKKYGVI